MDASVPAVSVNASTPTPPQWSSAPAAYQTHSMMKPPDTGGVASGAITVINVGDVARTDEGKNIKYYQTCNGVKTENEDDGSGSDGEVSKIDFNGVNLRTKKKRASGEADESRDGFVERPMSWEGELSDAEMTVQPDNKDHEEMEGVQICGVGNVPTTTLIEDMKHPLIFRDNPVDKPLGAPRHAHPRPHPRPHPPTPSPDSAIHSCCSPTHSPVASRHGSSYTPSLSRNNSDASYSSSCYGYSSVSVSPTQFSPTHSPIQSRHFHTGFPSPVLHRAADCSPLHLIAANGHMFAPRHALGSVDEALLLDSASTDTNDERDAEDKLLSLSAELGGQHSALAAPGISRQQLINSPCPICGDKISGFHYGIFSCESCKGFFKRTVQNRKNYVCLRGSACPVTIATRKKCPACRFDKCLKMGMKLEAIREDRTRGGRSTYQCSYQLPAALTQPAQPPTGGDLLHVKLEGGDAGGAGDERRPAPVPQLLQEIMEVEHLWHHNDAESGGSKPSGAGGGGPSRAPPAAASPDFLSSLCNIADHRLYRLVKWCKSLPLFKNISIDDQISLLINAWCELLLFSCCFRSMCSPGEIRVSLGKSISLAQARDLGLGACIERMLNFTEHLRRLRVDKYEYVAMKVIVLLTSDANDLRECEKVRASQEKALEALQHYTLAHYPDIPSKFGELLLRIPELQRTCQVGKEMLSVKNKESEGPSFNLLMELLRGDH